MSVHEFRPAAAADIEQAYRWYERAREGLGEEFLEELRATVERILAQPEANPIVHRQTRRALVRRFPYCLFYRVLEGAVVFVACFHARRDPSGWKRRR